MRIESKIVKSVFLTLFLTVVLAFFLIAGCSSQQSMPAGDEQDEQQKETTVKSTSKTETTRAETEPEPEETVEAEPVKVLTKKMKQLLQKHEGRVANMMYMYQDQTNKPEEWQTWVKDNKMHIELRQLDNVRGEVYVDNIYLDLAEKTAVGYCEAKVYRCADPNTPVELNFNKYYRETPLDWIEKVTYAELISDEQINSRKVWKVKYEEGDKQVFMWIDDYYGVSSMIREVRDGVVNEYIFEDISFNSVEDSDLEHPFVTTSYKN
jgi:hypothetical protein